MFSLLLFCITDGEHADAHIAGLGQFFGTGADSGTCGDNIIDDEHVLAVDMLCVLQAEDILHVLLTFPDALAGL